MFTDSRIGSFVINEMTNERYNLEHQQGNIMPEELYVVTDDEEAFPSKKYVMQNFSNAIVKNVKGNYISLNDVSPIAHEVRCVISGGDFSTSTLRQYGNNLLNIVDKKIAAGTLNDSGENYVIATGELGNFPGTSNATSGRVRYNNKGIYLQAGKLRFRVKYTVLDNPNNVAFDENVYLFVVGSPGPIISKSLLGVKEIGVKYDIAGEFEIKTSGIYHFEISLNSKKVSIEDFIISYGDQNLYEGYIEPVEYKIPIDGTVDGIVSHYPNMTFLVDSPNSVIDLSYNQDIVSVLNSLLSDIKSLKARVLSLEQK